MKLSIVSQEPFLFNASVKRNIAYCKNELTQMQIEEAAIRRLDVLFFWFCFFLLMTFVEAIFTIFWSRFPKAMIPKLVRMVISFLEDSVSEFALQEQLQILNSDPSFAWTSRQVRWTILRAKLFATR